MVKNSAYDAKSSKKYVMTPQEKAKELYGKFFRVTPQPYTIREVETEPFMGLQFNEWDKDWTERMAKQCALIAVDECLKMLEGLNKPEYVLFDIYEPKQYSMNDEDDFNGYVMQDYWQQVKEEIEKL